MAKILSSRISLTLDSGCIVRVDTPQCFYQVSITTDEIIVNGPGVSESIDLPEIIRNPDLPPETKAAIAVLFFEGENS